MKLFNKIVELVSVLFACLPVLFYFKLKIKTLSTPLKVLFFYLIFSLLNEFICFWFFSRTANSYVYNVFTFVEGLSIIVIYKNIIQSEKNGLYFLALIVFFSLCFAVSGLLGQLSKHSPFLLTVETVIVIALSITYFFRLINNVLIPKLTDYYLFWLNTSFLIYFCGSLFIFIFENFILYNQDKNMRNLWILHNFFNIVYNILLAKSIYTWKKTRP